MERLKKENERLKQKMHFLCEKLNMALFLNSEYEHDEDK